MGFENKNLSVIAYANGFTLWHYHAKEPIENVLVDGYFNKVSELIENGDIIFIVHGTNSYARCMHKSDNTIKLKNIN